MPTRAPVVGVPRREKCAKCGLPVFIAERMNVGKQLYHSTCFRCARCNSQLTLANYYETETKNQFCCETCPDEFDKKAPEKLIISRSLSDEEKSASIIKSNEQDDYSAMFETALEFPDLSSTSEVSSTEFTRARSHFMSSQIEDDFENTPPDLPTSKPPEKNLDSYDSGLPSNTQSIELSVNNNNNSVKKSEEDGASLVQSRMRFFQNASTPVSSKKKDVPDTKVETADFIVPSVIISETKNEVINNGDGVCEAINEAITSVCEAKNDIIIEEEINEVNAKQAPISDIENRVDEIMESTVEDESNMENQVQNPIKVDLESETKAKVENTILEQKFENNVNSEYKIKLDNKVLNSNVELEKTRKLDEILSTDKNFDEKMQPIKYPSKSTLSETKKKSIKNLLPKSNLEEVKVLKKRSEKLENTKLNSSMKSSSEATTKDITNKNMNNLKSLNNQVSKSKLDNKKRVDNNPHMESTKRQKLKNKFIQSMHNDDSERNQTNNLDTISNKLDISSNDTFTLFNSPIDQSAKITSKSESESVNVYKPDKLNKHSNSKFEQSNAVKEELDIEKVKDKILAQENDNLLKQDINKALPSDENEIDNLKNKSNLNNNLEYEKNDEAIKPKVSSPPIDKKFHINQIESFRNDVEDTILHNNLEPQNVINLEKKDMHNDIEKIGKEVQSITKDDELNTDSCISKEINVDKSLHNKPELIQRNTHNVDKNISSTQLNLVEDLEEIDLPKLKNTSTKPNLINSIINNEELETGIKLDKFLEEPDLKEIAPCLDADEEGRWKMDEYEAQFEELVKQSELDDGDVEVPAIVVTPVGGDLSGAAIEPGETESVKSSQDKDEYPEDLNPFDDAPPESKPGYDEALNPFGDDEDDKQVPVVAAPRLRKIIPLPDDDSFLNDPSIRRVNTNPFEDEYVIEEPVKKIISAAKIGSNPFESEDEEIHKKPVATPRRTERTPRISGISTGSTTSASSGGSAPQSVRKKKAAPKPPVPFDQQESPLNSLNSSPSTSVQHSPRPRKSKRAPLPPTTSTPLSLKREMQKAEISPISDAKIKGNLHSPLSPTSSLESGEYEKEKFVKDELNRTKQNQSHVSAPDKSTYGKWKRKKGQAPSKPIPQKRTIKALPIAEVKRELDIIEVQLQGLEKQGVRLEQIIRDHCEGPNSDPDSAITIEAEDLILQLFEVVNEKNEICRRQSELMYSQRQHRLEEEHADVEYQIRCLMLQPEANKTDSDKAREEELINRLVEIVERRSEIVECLELDRVREAEEDDSICNSMNTYASKRDESSANESSPKKKEKKKFKKKFKLKSSKKVDVDKDVDECDTAIVVKSKKKFNLF